MKKWEMEAEGIDTVLDKVWDLHDKLSDAILSIARAHFPSSLNSSLLRPHSDVTKMNPSFPDSGDIHNRAPYVFVKGFPVDFSAIEEAKSLNTIRIALENLEAPVLPYCANPADG